MEKPLFEKAYDPKAWEDTLYTKWKKAGFFNPDASIEKGVTDKDAEPYSIVLPPPNVTGTLHVGHAAMLAIEDAFVRYKRMRGFKTLWIPGTDHAAIATQSKVEKILAEEGKSRHDLGREEFLHRVEDFAKKSHDTIVNQVAKMGSSVDWSREAYTLDEKRSLAVRTAFERMHKEGIIYRGNRIVNWDSVGQTTISDDEVIYKEEKAKLYYLKYGPFEIATARPETKFGDKYVVMHPEDERYAKYKDGEKLTLEWINGPIEATIIKDEAIDKEFGTGVMTITPWHSHVDFDLATRHKLDIEQIIDINGKLLAIAGEFAGQPISEAREKIVEKLEKKGLLVKVDEKYVHQVATAERSGAIIEPQIMRQWFVDVNKEFERDGEKVSLKSLMHDAVSENEIQILPERFEKTYFHWINNLRDWCISRQIWYGHRIPVWYCLSCENQVVNAKVKSKWFLVRHGETDWNKQRKMQGSSDIPLNETGQKQAQAIAVRLQKNNIEAIFSSDLLRAKETAEIIGKAVNAEVVIDTRLRERHTGKAEGMHLDEIPKVFPGIFSYHTKHPEAENESYEETEHRMWEAVSEHTKEHLHKNVLIVSHSGSLRSLLRRIQNVAPEAFHTVRRLGNAEPVQLDILDSPCEKCGNHFFEQDPDTLDTWFSSGLWTFSTLGWPEKTKDFETYHPTSLLETGYDILFFWVARMVLMSKYLLDEPPFKTVYLHGLVRDEKGRKMSKSLGNIVDPLDVIEKFGADALRLALVMGATPGNDMKVGDEKITAMRNFVNKLWNMGRYVSTAVAPENLTWNTKDARPVSPADHWILSRLENARKKVTAHLDSYNLSLAAEELRAFSWDDFADWYVEVHKIEKNDALLVLILNELLTLWHPFMPFVTEAMFSTLYPKEKLPLMVQKWEPSELLAMEKNAVDFFESLTLLVKKVRNIRAIYHIDPKQLLKITLVSKDRELKESFSLIERLGRVESISTTQKEKQPKESARIVIGAGLIAYVHLEGVIDIQKEKVRLSKEEENLMNYTQNLSKRLSDTNFTDRAPANIVELEKKNLAEAKTHLTQIQESISNLS